MREVYAEKVDYGNLRVHWEFRNDEVKTPLGKLGSTVGRPLPEHFSLSLLATGQRFSRRVNGQGTLSWKRYRLSVRVELKRRQVEIREFFDSLVILYQSGSVVSVDKAHEQHEIASIANDPIFHEHPGIEESPQLELFNVAAFGLRYVTRRPPNQKRRKLPKEATQLEIDFAPTKGL